MQKKEPAKPQKNKSFLGVFGSKNKLVQTKTVPVVKAAPKPKGRSPKQIIDDFLEYIEVLPVKAPKEQLRISQEVYDTYVAETGSKCIPELSILRVDMQNAINEKKPARAIFANAQAILTASDPEQKIQEIQGRLASRQEETMKSAEQRIREQQAIFEKEKAKQQMSQDEVARKMEEERKRIEQMRSIHPDKNKQQFLEQVNGKISFVCPPPATQPLTHLMIKSCTRNQRRRG